MLKKTQKQLLDELARQYKDGKTETKDYIVNLMAYRAAMTLMLANGAFEAAEKKDEPPKYDKKQLEQYVQLMKDAGIEEEAHRLYGDSQFVPEPLDVSIVPFLYDNARKLMNNERNITVSLVAMQAAYGMARGQTGKNTTAREAWFLAKANETDPETPYAEEDKFVYEYSGKADADVSLNIVAHYPELILSQRLGRGGETNVDRHSFYQEHPIDELNLRNKQTVEKLNRGDAKRVCEARDKVEASFTFQNSDDLHNAQEQASEVLVQMRAQTGSATKTKEWQNLLSAMKSFVSAGDPAAAADHSAAVLLATEKFTKGRKSRWQRQSTLDCVDLAVNALGATVPDAGNNACVKPLMDRFDEVRGDWRPIRQQLKDNGYKPREKAMRFDEKRMWRNAAEFRHRIADGLFIEAIDPAMAKKALAGMVALKKLDDEAFKPEELHRRAEELERDPVVQRMVEKLSDSAVRGNYQHCTTLEQLPFTAARRYVEAKQEMDIAQQERQEQERREQQERQEQERRERQEQARKEILEYEESQKRERQENPVKFLPDDVMELFSIYYKINDYELEQGEALFAKLIAYDELSKQGQEIDPKAFTQRAEELKADGKVAKLAGELLNTEHLSKYGESIQDADPLSLAGELGKLYKGEQTVEQWKEQILPPAKKAPAREKPVAQKPVGQQGGKKRDEDAVGYQIDDLLGDMKDEPTVRKPVVKNTVRKDLQELGGELAGEVGEDLKVSAAYKEKVADYYRRVIASYKAYGDRLPNPSEQNRISRISEEYRNLKNDQTFEEMSDLALLTKADRKKTLENMKNGSLEEIVKHYREVSREMPRLRKAPPPEKLTGGIVMEDLKWRSQKVGRRLEDNQKVTSMLKQTYQTIITNYKAGGNKLPGPKDEVNVEKLQKCMQQELTDPAIDRMVELAQGSDAGRKKAIESLKNFSPESIVAQYKEVSKQLESEAKQQRDPDAGSRQNEQQEPVLQ